jgi:hypothetical protein
MLPRFGYCVNNTGIVIIAMVTAPFSFDLRPEID